MKRKKKKKIKQTKFLEGRIHEGNFLGAVIDNENNQIRVYSNDMLQKRIQRDSNIIGKSFDKLCHDELSQMGELFSKATFLISNGFFRANQEESELKLTSSKLLMNASITIQAAVELLRTGYTLQPCMLLRSVIETISTVAYFLMEPDAHQVYLDGKLDVNKTIRYGKQLIPNLGYLQGILSNHFVHISSLHSDLNGITKHIEVTQPLRVNLNMIKVCMWCLFVTSEVTFYDYFDDHIYWTKISEIEYKFKQNEEEKKWMSEFLKEE
ncbi:hypothetical protein [Paenibacillus jilunlii]|uniref:Uncharacterized protein n=1 Tax=Paenibacillus jilunlii TaxID=682956 RepID=A0A1G9JC51_9BACL|nr:hypothetical protein [Paenibacillus jilunlii]KWX74833.1 hypothetical protein AML91_14425 [Paenibacillus jilunlii]SDL34785.1 hypothetical protein SAMN05216191_102410 [Paenibacillus jilunlii]